MSGSFDLDEKNFENLIHLHLKELLRVARGENAHDVFSVSEKRRLDKAGILSYVDGVRNLHLTSKTKTKLLGLGYTIP